MADNKSHEIANPFKAYADLKSNRLTESIALGERPVPYVGAVSIVRTKG